MASHNHPSGHWADVRFPHFFIILVITSVIISSTLSSPASFSSSSDPNILVENVDDDSDVDPQVKLSTKTDIGDVLPSTAMTKPDIGCGCEALQLVIDEVRETKDVCIDTAFAVGVHVKTVRKLQVAVDGLASLRDTNHADTYVSPTSPRTHIMSSSDDAALSATSSSSIEDIITEIEKDRKSDRDNGRPDIETPPSLLEGVHLVIMEPPDVIPRDCLEVQQQVGNVTGVYTILPDGCGQPFQVFCDMATSGGGWTVIQRRLNGEVSFARLWGAYRRGFGNLLTEFWMGLDKMSRLTSQDDYELRIDLQDYNGTKATAEYESMMVSDYRSNYRLLVGSFKANGSAGDSLSYHNHMPFTTTDRDNDLAKKNCAQLYSQGGWWYNGCLYSNLNGLYLGPENDEFAAGVTWFEFGGFRGSLKLAEMKVRPVP
ncbi:fibrinogen C domain-containing protein 1 [Strongylocentrotus purpuratus]|uniref:Fibrinogen C-terminal domain-containing protein n=1 Tax=Strongylocentrotus purpuratus TaxID=7668 RepID=A0A7M7RGE4_STRPU|nr:fibrinogen C domain-containing protein 1 [Strongylocentrotus purpuratus]